MKLHSRVLSAILSVTLGSSLALTSGSVAQASTHSQRLAHAKAVAHKAALAAKHEAALHHLAALHHQAALKHNEALAEKHAKNSHLARLHALHEQHLAEFAAKHHPMKLSKAQKAHLARLAAKEAAANRQHEALAARHMSKAYRAHMARLAKQEHEHNVKLDHLAAVSANAHRAILREEARVARLSNIASHNEHIAMQKAAEAQRADEWRTRYEQLAEAHEARLAAHNARLAAMEARYGQQLAWQREQQALIDLEAAHGVTQWGTYTENVPMQVIMVDLNKPNIRVSALLAHHGIGTSEPFDHMIERSHPTVAVTGTFFSLDNLKPVGDIVVNGNLAYFGGMGTALAITPDNKADMITVPWGRHHDWTGYDCVVSCGPRLLKDGDVCLDPAAERFHDRDMLGPNSRIAVGITPGNKLVFAMTRDRISLGRLANVMASLGCIQAMNLDAGTSTGFYCNGRMLATPGRMLTNAIVVHTDGRRTTASTDVATLPQANGG